MITKKKKKKKLQKTAINRARKSTVIIPMGYSPGRYQAWRSCNSGHQRAAIVVTEELQQWPPNSRHNRHKGRERHLYKCSYEEANGGYDIWLTEDTEPKEQIIIYIDNQSQCMAMINHNPEMDDIRYAIQHHEGQITIQWMSDLPVIPGKEQTDAKAKNTPQMPTNVCNFEERDYPKVNSVMNIMTN